MKLGLVSAILGSESFEEMLRIAGERGIQCIETACWPAGNAERRYAGVSHIDVDRVLKDDEYTEQIQKCLNKYKMEISSLAYYPNPMTDDIPKRKMIIEHLEKVILAAKKLQVNMVSTFIGRDQKKTVDENLELVKEIWPPILKLAEENQVKIAIENCPMLFDGDQWPGGQNLMTTPVIWEKVFQILDSPWIGLNYDPSHFVWQMMDYIRPIETFKDKIFNVHCKDIKLYPEKLKICGSMAYPLEYMAPKLPGLGDVDWGAFISALTDIGYQGNVCLEIEDKAFEANQEQIRNSITLSANYIRQYVI